MPYPNLVTIVVYCAPHFRWLQSPIWGADGVEFLIWAYGQGFADLVVQA